MEKIKNMPVIRLLAFALIVAIVLGLPAVMLSFTASAETADETVSQLGTLGSYDCIKFKAGQKIDFNTLYEQRNRYNSQYVWGAVFGYKDGKFVNFKNNNFSIRPQSNSDYFDVFFCGTTMYGNWVSGDKAVLDSVYYQYGVYNSSYCSMCLGVKDNEASVKGSVKLAESSQSFYDSVGDTLYLVYTSSNTLWDTTNVNDFCNDIINNLTAVNYKDIDTGSEPSAKFVTCASFTNDDGSFPLWCKSFVAEGQQYPLFTYFIKDNGNKHKYSLVLSYNNNDVAGALCTALYDNLTNDMWRTSLKIPSLSYVSAHIFPMHNAGDMMVKAALRYFESGWKNATFSQSFNLNGSDMDFSNSADSGNKVYTLCLSDYSAIVAGQIYKVEIWDNTISEILDTTYFVSRDSFGKSNSGTGVKIYDYKDDGDRMEQDIINNTPSVTPGTGSDFKTTGDIEWSQFNDDLTNVDITSIFSSLHSAINSVGVFFQACWAIIPSSIFAILLSGLSLIIVLRLLGR